MNRLIFASCVSALAITAATATAQDYPARDITNVVVWSAGGGTDVSNRVVSAAMADALGVNINVTNRPGGVAGSQGMNYVHGQDADGYTLVGLSESVVTAGVQGGWDQRMDVWYPFIIGGSPDLISVNADAPYQTLGELIAAAEANPDTILASASGAGSIHHLNLLALVDGTGAALSFVPYPGSAPAQNAAMTGEVEVVVTSLAEQQQLLRSGALRPLAMLTPEPFELADVGVIPSAFDEYPQLTEYLPISQAIGLAVSADAPDDVKSSLSDAFAQAIASDDVQQWAEENYYVLSGAAGDDAAEEFARLESLFAWTLHDLGAAEVDPST
ncbi:MAG: tripartite tricarboxylate transporter substrate binding protein, partial [Pseudomonadota bacterium]